MPQVVRVNIKLPSHFTSFQKTNLEWDDCLNRSLGSDPVITLADRYGASPEGMQKEVSRFYAELAAY